MRVNDSEMSIRWNSKAWSILEISSEIAKAKEQKNSEKDGFLTFYEKGRLNDQRQMI